MNDHVTEHIGRKKVMELCHLKSVRMELGIATYIVHVHVLVCNVYVKISTMMHIVCIRVHVHVCARTNCMHNVDVLIELNIAKVHI